MKILILEDNADDATLLQATLKRSGVVFQATVVSNRIHFIEALESGGHDIILSDHQLPQFSSPEALEIARQMFPFIPFILITGTVSDEFAASIIKKGADDYLLKNNLQRLPTAIEQVFEKKETEKSRALLVSIINSSEDAIISKTLDGNITSWNNGAARIFGYTAAEVIGRNISILIPPGFVNEEPEIIAKIRKGEFIEHYETLRLHKNGRLIHISLTVSAIRDNRGNITGASKIARDITEKREAEQKIIQSEENLKAIFDNTSEGFILTTTDGIVKSFNERAKNSVLLNARQEIAPGKNIFDLIDVSRKQQLKKIITTVIQNQTIQYDRLYSNPAGFGTWINFSFSPVIKNNAVTGICITGRDITEKKMAEQQREFDHNNLYALINNTKDLMWSVDRNFQLITSNQSFDELVETITGKIPEKGSDILIKEFNEKQLQRYKKYYMRAFSGQSFIETEYSDQPHPFWSEISFYPIHKNKSVIGTACFSRNITERKKAEEELKKSFTEKRELAERVTAILNTLPANIALLNHKGVIADVNDSWRDFAGNNGFVGHNHGIGDNYIEISKASFDKEGKKVAQGILAVLKNKLKEFVFEYPCHSPEIKRWFRMVVSPLQDKAYTGVVVMHIDISELRRLERERLENKIAEQKNIARVMLQAQEQERNQLGRELHDNISQLLAAIKMKLRFCLSHYDKGIPVVTECVVHVEEAITEARNLSHRMVMPRFAEINFENALTDLIGNYNNENRKTRLKTTGLKETVMPASIKESLYRILQEQLNNIEKYAKATKVVIDIHCVKDHVRMLIKDNGIGFDTGKKRRGIGLTNILNRAESYSGIATIISEPGKGCGILVEIPLCEFV